MIRDAEETRRTFTALLQWGAWAANVGIFFYATLEFDPNHGKFAPQWVGFAFIFSLGVAIAASVARSRMRLTTAILGAYTAGLEAAREETDRRVRAITDRMDKEEEHHHHG